MCQCTIHLLRNLWCIQQLKLLFLQHLVIPGSPRVTILCGNWFTVKHSKAPQNNKMDYLDDFLKFHLFYSIHYWLDDILIKMQNCAASSSYVLLLCISVFASGMNNDLLKKSIITTLQISRRDPSSKRNFAQQQDSKSSLNCETVCYCTILCIILKIGNCF